MVWILLISLLYGKQGDQLLIAHTSRHLTKEACEKKLKEIDDNPMLAADYKIYYKQCIPHSKD